MATAVSPEYIPTWARSREKVFKAKLMDDSAFVPFDQLPEELQRRQQGRWIAYTLTLEDPKRAYIYQKVVDTVEGQAKGRAFFSLADLGAGNGKNTIKTATMLHQRTSPAVNIVHLIEQSGAALEGARNIFRQNGFSTADWLGERSRNRTSINFRQSDITDTGLANQSIDAVTCVNVWHHLPSWDRLMASADEIHRILRPGGLFVIVDTRPLPASGLKRHIIEGSIRRVVNADQFIAKAKKEGQSIGDAEAEGIRDFCEHDAFKAFENALAKPQFEETLRRSALAPSLQRIEDLLSPHPVLRMIYPPLNFAWGIKPLR